MIEFQLAWCKRNVPRDRQEFSFLVCDSGQFMFDDAGLTGLIDFELGYIGDYAADLAGLRTRDLSEPIGELGRAMRRYGEISGREIDLRAIDYHTIRFAMLNPLSLAAALAKPSRDANYVQYLGWSVCYGRAGLEVMARYAGVELDPPRLPDGRALPSGDRPRASRRPARPGPGRGQRSRRPRTRLRLRSHAAARDLPRALGSLRRRPRRGRSRRRREAAGLAGHRPGRRATRGSSAWSPSPGPSAMPTSFAISTDAWRERNRSSCRSCASRRTRRCLRSKTDAD